MKNNWYNRFVYNLDPDHFGPTKWGWFIIPNFIWNSGIARKYQRLREFTKKAFE